MNFFRLGSATLILLSMTAGHVRSQTTSTQASSRRIEVHGKVTDSTGAPLSGVSVTVPGSAAGTQTDRYGNYALYVPLKSGTLDFSIIGYASRHIRLSGAHEYPVRLDADSRQLTELVVTDGYFTQAKKSYTGAAATVSGLENENKPFSTPLIALQGEVAGLNIAVANGQPGANLQVNLRGLGSTALNANPLYVIDGMIINAGDLSRISTTSNVLAGINQDDIESVTVLKDASATAIYGSRGSNGVIIITTKKGRVGRLQVALDVEKGSSNINPLPAAGQPLNPSQFTTMFTEGLTNTGTYTPAQVTALATSYGLYSGKSNNWQNLVYRTGTQQQYNVSVRGGNETTKLFASAGYFQQQATTIESDLKRYTGLINVDQKISKRINFTTGLNISNVFQHAPVGSIGSWANPVFASQILRPFQLAYNPDGTLNSSSSGNTGFPAHYNPLYIAAHDRHTLSQTRVLGNTSLNWNIWSTLKYTSYISVDYDLLEESEFENPILGDGQTTQGYDAEDYTRYFNWLTRNQLDYRYAIPHISDFYVDAAVGYEAQKSTEYALSASGTGFPLTQPTLTSLADAANPTAAGASTSAYSFNSVYSRVSVNYKNLVSASGSFRKDGSSVFGGNNQYGSFWSAGGAWNIDQENFFRTQRVFSSAKLRASYGTTGNAQGITDYAWRALASYGSNYTNGNGQNYNVVGNPDLTWEKQKKFDVGADAGFFRDRLLLTGDYYVDNIDGLIQSVAISGTTGFTSVPYDNSGAMQNRGFELAVKGVPVRTRDFTWSTGFNIAFNHNQITQLGNASGANAGTGGVYYYLQKGYDYHTYYVPLYAGVNPANGSAQWYTDGTRSKTTTTYSSAARVPYKSASPKYFGGFTNTLTFKGITLSADLYYNFGNYIPDEWSTRFYDGAYYTFNKYQREYERRWTHPGQVTDVPIYIAGGGVQSNSQAWSTRFLYKGDFIRLKNLTAGYDLRKTGVFKSFHGVSKLYVYARATNLWKKTFDDKLPYDPESGTVTIPQFKTFTAGINIGL